jgi:hypothetical protein
MNPAFSEGAQESHKSKYTNRVLSQEHYAVPTHSICSAVEIRQFYLKTWVSHGIIQAFQ